MKLVNPTFQDVVQSIYDLPIEDKLELKQILENNIIEERRLEISENYKLSKKEELSGTMIFSNNITRLKKLL